MFDVLVKTAILAVIAALLTRRSQHATASDAHRLWLVVLFSPLLVLILNALLPPVAFLIPRVDVAAASTIVPGGWVFAVYGIVAAVLLGRVAIGLWAVRRLRLEARLLDGEDLARLRPLAGDPQLDLREADLLVPVTAGVLRPCVILPQGWRELSRSALTAILRHEAAHVRRRDCALALAGAVLEAVFWFNPAVWMASARLRWFAEMACDADAAVGMARGEYAAELLDLSAGWAGARSPRYAITAGAETHVARRIRLLIDGIECTGRRGSLLPTAVIVILLATILSAGVRVSSSRSVDATGWRFDHGAAHSLGHGH
jgi:beta-lactamase regulating signal transducer with metallopeptidase domain